MNGLELRHLNVSVGNFRLRDISLPIPQGTILGLVGKNGAGKTTLIRTIATVMQQESGVIYYNGVPFWENDEQVMGELGVMFDQMQVNEQLKVCKLIRILAKCDKRFDRAWFETQIGRFEIPLKTKIGALSFGQKKKLSLLLVLSVKPKILILDEPTSGIDPTARVEILDLLQDFLLDETHTILFSTHITSDLDKIADYIAMLDGGELVFSEEKEEMRQSYALIQAPEECLNEEIRRSLIGVKKTSFGVQALCKDRKLLANLPGITVTTTNIEEIMVHLTGNFEEVSHDVF